MMKNKITLSLLSSAGLGAIYAQIPQKPNIIWLMAEDMGQDLECYGMKAVKTPNLNKMAAQGVLYNAAYCTNPISSPSRSAMMTGVHQVVTDSHNHRSNREKQLADPFKPITYYLRQNGYTCILGHDSVMGKGRKIDCNFKYKNLGPWDGVDNFGLFDKYDEFTAEDQPFFAQVQLAVTHRGDWWKRITEESEHPVNPADVELPPYMPEHPKVRTEWASYLDQVEYMDNEVGMLLNELKQKGMLDNTIIFFIGDNGRCNVRGKGYLYEPGIKIPMIAWGKSIHSSEVNEIVSTLDISATILDLAGVEIPDYYQGKPLFDKKEGKVTKGQTSFYAARDNWDEIIDCIRSLTTDKYKYIRNYMPEQGWDLHQQYLDFHRPALHVMRQLKTEGRLNEAQLLFMADRKPVEELYDLSIDPFELHNLAEDSDYKSTLQHMRSQMDLWQKRNEDKGLKDRNNRVPQDMGSLRDYVKEKYPREWKKLQEGDICDSYKKWSNEVRNLRTDKSAEK